MQFALKLFTYESQASDFLKNEINTDIFKLLIQLVVRLSVLPNSADTALLESDNELTTITHLVSSYCLLHCLLDFVDSTHRSLQDIWFLFRSLAYSYRNLFMTTGKLETLRPLYEHRHPYYKRCLQWIARTCKPYDHFLVGLFNSAKAREGHSTITIDGLCNAMVASYFRNYYLHGPTEGNDPLETLQRYFGKDTPEAATSNILGRLNAAYLLSFLITRSDLIIEMDERRIREAKVKSFCQGAMMRALLFKQWGYEIDFSCDQDFEKEALLTFTYPRQLFLTNFQRSSLRLQTPSKTFTNRSQTQELTQNNEVNSLKRNRENLMPTNNTVTVKEEIPNKKSRTPVPIMPKISTTNTPTITFSRPIPTIDLSTISGNSFTLLSTEEPVIITLPTLRCQPSSSSMTPNIAPKRVLIMPLDTTNGNNFTIPF